MKVLVIGKNGFIGGKIIDYLSGRGYDVGFTEVDGAEGCFGLNLLSPEEFDYSVISEDDFVIFPAGISSPDFCEDHYDEAYKINVTGTGYVIDEFLLKGARVLFFSSDLVYGKSEGTECFDEESDLNPIMQYARMKREIEDRFGDDEGFKVIRMSYVFSKDDKYTSYLTSCAEKGDEAEIYHPIFRNVVYLGDVLKFVEILVNDFVNIKPKIINACGMDLVSRKDIAQAYKEFVDDSLKFKIVNPGEDFFITRPEKICMKSLYFDKVLGRAPLSMVDAMKLEFNK